VVVTGGRVVENTGGAKPVKNDGGRKRDEPKGISTIRVSMGIRYNTVDPTMTQCNGLQCHRSMRPILMMKNDHE
jgi:hypothetical protein